VENLKLGLDYQQTAKTFYSLTVKSILKYLQEATRIKMQVLKSYVFNI
jgi:hypothetical protein